MIKLTPAQLREYETQGFVLAPGVFPAGELSELDREIDRLEAPAAADAPHRGWVMSLAQRSEKTRAFAQDERLLALIEEIVRPGIAIYSAKLTAKPPRSPEVCHWHQDDAYYIQNSSSRTRMSVWVPLQDATPENGCLWVVPGSHRAGLQEHVTRPDGQCRLSMPEPLVDLSKAVPAPARAGSVLLFSALLWHASKGNATDGKRRAFIVSYQEASTVGGNGAQWKILRPAS
ncbi:MAG: phytanoyl-CoA dioxygenase family protein [Planctomycetota bacterium]|nr:phytanoyl-CoA dioxygenase family protein [Planctomycetota bacterium]